MVRKIRTIFACEDDIFEFISPSRVVIHIVHPSIFVFVSSRILRKMSMYILIFHVMIFFTRTSGLAEAEGSWRKLTEVLKMEKNT